MGQKSRTEKKKIISGSAVAVKRDLDAQFSVPQRFLVVPVKRLFQLDLQKSRL